MIENRKFYRLPSNARFVLGNNRSVFSGKATNMSFGGSFIHLLAFNGIQNGDKLKCDFMLSENSAVLTSMVQVRRVALGSSNPSDYSGLGIEFTEFHADTQTQLEEYLFDQKRIYELLGTLLMNTEPDMRSMRPLISKLPVSKMTDIRDLRLFVESTLKAIQMVERKNEAPIAPL